MYSFCPDGQGQVPLQPFDIPARLPSLGQVGVQAQRPSTQRPFVPQLLVHLHVSMQVPLLQMLPAAHVTLAHGFGTHLPPEQLSPVGHTTPAHGLGVVQVRSQANPAPQSAAQARRAAHFPVAGLQNWPAGQVTPLQATAKHPVTQSPSTQVCPCGHVLPAHGSVTRTQVAWQALPAAQVPAGAVVQGSAWQAPPRQTWPVPHAVPGPQCRAPASAVPPAPPSGVMFATSAGASPDAPLPSIAAPPSCPPPPPCPPIARMGSKLHPDPSTAAAQAHNNSWPGKR
jgi:hypothetical protein